MQLINQKTPVILLILFFIANTLTAQGNYYDGSNELYGESLKALLHNKINNHIRFPYSSSSTDTWDILKQTDKDPNNGSNVLLIYTNYSVNAAQEYNNGNGWNREHVWANSHGFSDNGDTAYTDVHHLRPSDISTNGTRGNKDFDYGGSSTAVLNNHYDSDSWEPRDEIKGDIARMMLYMTVRYEGGDGYDLELVDYTPSSGPNFGKKSVLLEWNRLDPISAFERNRNRVIYKYQKNFNPFVDHPEFADRIYNSDKLIIEFAEQVGESVILTFSKELNSTEAEKVANYQIYELGNPTSATPNFGGNSKKVQLSFSESFADTFYNVRASNLTSTEGETIIPNSIATFMANETTATDSTPPAAPSDLIAESAGGEINLNWTENSEPDLSHYTIYRGAIKNFTPSQYTILTTVTENFYSDSEVFDYRVYYIVSAVDKSGNESDYSNESSILVGVEDESQNPNKFALSQNYPNPFNPSTRISYEIGKDGFVNISVYNSIGQKVYELVDEYMETGKYNIEFNAASLPSGLYFYRLETANYSHTMKMILIK